jgi:hypothetical protein
MGDVSRFVVAWILALVLLSTATFAFSLSVEHIPAVALRDSWRSRIFEPAGIDRGATSSSPLLNMRLGAPFPFGMVSSVLCASTPSEWVQVEQKQVSMLQASETKEAKKDVVSTEVVKEQTGVTAQSTRHRHWITNESDSNLVPRSHATGSTTPHLLLLAPIPLVLNVDTANGKDALSCVESPAHACKTIRYALEKGQLEAPKQSRPLLEIQVAAGEYLGECSEEGNIVAMAITLKKKKKAGGGEVLIDCKGAGSLVNITHDSSATSQLEGLTIANGVSKRGGGAASVRGGRMVLKECVFRELKSLASGDFVGGGAVSFVVSAVLLEQHSVHRIDLLVAMPCSNTRSFVVSVVCRAPYHWRSTGVPLPSAPPLLVPVVRLWSGSKRWWWRRAMHLRS